MQIEKIPTKIGKKRERDNRECNKRKMKETVIAESATKEEGM